MFQCAMKPRDSLSLWHRLFHDSRGTTLPLDSMRAATQSAPDTAFPPHRAFRLRSVYLRTEDRRLRALAHTEAGRGELISENGNVFRGFAISPHGSQNTFAWKAQSPMRELRFSFAEAKPVQGFLMVRKHFSGYPPILSDEHAESVRSWRFSYQRNSWVHLS
jgi:hypothetical protein